MSEQEENVEEGGAVLEGAPAEAIGAETAEDDGGTEIRDTDIVFDCPHCGHNLAIDYRGAGLQIECVNCGESVLVPIPDGMKIDDLDIEPGEILKQLFATRRNLQRAEARIEALEVELGSMTVQRNTLRSLVESFAIGLEEFKELSRNEAKLREKALGLMDRLTSDVNSTVGKAAHGGMVEGDEPVVSAE